MIQSDYKSIFQEFSSKKILIVGDVMIDAYLHGNVDRISPEAPVPVVHVTKKEYKSGGAANVALNVVALGAQAYMCSVVGNDEDGEKLRGLLKAKGVNCKSLVSSPRRPTTIKTRILSNGQQILRVDNEIVQSIDDQTEKDLTTQIESLIGKMDLVILEDYNKGLLTPSFITKIIAIANKKNVPVSVDPKKENFLQYKNVSLFKPNRKEIIEGLKLDNPLKSEKDIKSALKALQKKLKAETIMVTLSEDGVVVLDQDEFTFIPAHKRNIYDVSGAGDTVISVASLCIAAGMNRAAAAAISNIAGGLVCERPGVVQVDKDQLLAEIEKIYL
jgi:rfaE bifunctional protein kinase chain/domain